MSYIDGRSRTRAYDSWRSMIYRCTRADAPNYAYYGGRGVKVCERWQVFGNFLADMGERPAGMSIERVSNDGDYEPGNCRWATQSEQQRNSRNARLGPAEIAWIKSGPGVSLRQMARTLGVSLPTVLKWRDA